MAQEGTLDTIILIYILTGIVVGFIGRWWMLRGDIRQYPTYPNGYLIHLTTGFIASAIGSVAYPALRAENYVAVTFLTIAIQQFRDIRKMEKESLEDLERVEYAPRGEAYIDGIAKTFEARNYIVMLAALATTTTAFIFKELLEIEYLVVGIAAIIGIAIIYLLKNYSKGQNIGDIVTIEEAPLEFRDGSQLYVGDIYVMNVGLSATRKRILKNGIGIIIKPNGEREKVILNHRGQRSAIAHECSRLLGLERYLATRRNFDTGDIVLAMVPIRKDVGHLIDIIRTVPIFEVNKKSYEQRRN